MVVAELRVTDVAADFAWNARPYDERGWPSLEQGAAATIAAHLAEVDARGQLPKRFALAQASRPKLIDISNGVTTFPNIDSDPARQLDQAVAAINAATFTGKGDREVVTELLWSFHDVIKTGLVQWSSQAARAEEAGLGAVVLEMAGACWVLPEFAGRVGDDDMITTFKSHLVRQLGGRADEAKDKDAADAVRELWGVDGSVRNLPTHGLVAIPGPTDAPALGPPTHPPWALTDYHPCAHLRGR